MKVLLIYPCEMAVYVGTRFEFKRRQECLPPLNLAALAGALRAAGHEVRAVDLQVEPDAEAAVRGAIRAWRPGLVGITFKTPLYDQARRIARWAREESPEARIVGGGVHATCYPADCLRETDMDVVVIGEGDETIVRLADGAPLESIPGIAFRRRAEPRHGAAAEGAAPVLGEVVFSASSDACGGIEPLDRLPFPDWTIFDLARYRRTSRLFYQSPPVGFLETSRGCRGRCVFCSKGVYGSRWRAKSPRRVVDEMEHMLRLGFREIEIVDDAFTTDLPRAAAICEEMLRRGLDVPWCCRNGLRTSDVDEAFFRLARRAGLHLVAFGFETGDAELLKATRKGASLEQGRRAAEWARRAGITVMGYFLMGLPGETRETLQSTIDYACSLPLDFVKYNLAIPLPGTELNELWRDRIRAADWSQYNFHAPARQLYDHPTLDWDTIEAHLRRGYRRFYLRGGYLLRQLVRTIRQRRLGITARTALELIIGR